MSRMKLISWGWRGSVQTDCIIAHYLLHCCTRLEGVVNSLGYLCMIPVSVISPGLDAPTKPRSRRQGSYKWLSKHLPKSVDASKLASHSASATHSISKEATPSTSLISMAWIQSMTPMRPLIPPTSVTYHPKGWPELASHCKNCSGIFTQARPGMSNSFNSCSTIVILVKH